MQKPVPIPTLQYLSPEGTLSNNYTPSIADDILLQGYRAMVLARQIDERMLTLQRQGTITFAMSALGEEACAVASAAALELCDWIYPQYREAGVLFWRGCTPLQYIHHMFGNGKDWIYGRQMPNHFGSRELNVVTVSSPIGTKIPHAAGCAYAMKIQKKAEVAICFFGEGAASEGDFHAGINFAAVRKVPAIFFCRNNGYAISTPTSKQYASDGVAGRAVSYGIHTFRIDGNDFFAIHETVTKAKKLCLEGEGPVFIEAITYRMGAHSSSDDPSLYRSEQEVSEWKKKCPILRLRAYLEKRSLWNETKESELNAAIAQEITAAIEIAKKTPPPPLRYLIEHVYFEPTQPLLDEYERLIRSANEPPNS